MRQGKEQAELFYSGTKFCYADEIHGLFSIGDANVILGTNVPQQQVAERVVWSKLNDRIYTVKTGYQEW